MSQMNGPELYQKIVEIDVSIYFYVVTTDILEQKL
jgi:hypothetical protein